MSDRFRPANLPTSTSLRPGRSPPAYADERRDARLRAIAGVFAERGLMGVAFPHIAAAIELPMQTARAQFGNKELALEAVLDRHLDMVIDRLRLWDEAEQPTSPEQRLTLAIEVLIETLDAHRPAQRVHVAAMHGAPPRLARTLMVRQRYVTHWFAGLIAAAVPEMEARADLAMPLAMSLLGMACWHVLWFRELGAVARREYARLLALMLTEGARAGLREGLAAWEAPEHAV